VGRPRDHIAPEKIVKARPAGNNQQKVAYRSTKKQMWCKYISNIAWSRLGVEPAELSEIAENRNVFRVVLELLSPTQLSGKRV